MDVQKVAELARLKISPDSEKDYQEQFSKILKYFELLEDVKTEGVVPLITPVEMQEVRREDKAELWSQVEKALDNTQEKSGNLFKVPPVV